MNRRKFTRIKGRDRIDTSRAVAEAVFGQADVRVAVIANGFVYADALAGSSLAGSLGGPVLLTAPNKLSGPARVALQSLQPPSVMITGGKGAVSLQVQNEVRQLIR